VNKPQFNKVVYHNTNVYRGKNIRQRLQKVICLNGQMSTQRKVTKL